MSLVPGYIPAFGFAFFAFVGFRRRKNMAEKGGDYFRATL
jgi:hypothetical protein